MITVEVFDERVEALWTSQKSMARAKKWKSGKRAGTLRKPEAPIQFTRAELRIWLWKRVGLNAIPCPYCGAPIDILNLTLDHMTPRSLGGAFSLENTEPVCQDCNHEKGAITKDGFVRLLASLRNLSPYDAGQVLNRLKAAHHGSPQRFFRKPAQAPALAPTLPAPPPAKQKPLDLW